ncbi:unnamed protein product, partial [Adineta ricciae]
IYDTYEIEVKNTFGFEQSSAILSCEISPPSASSYVHVIGWLEKVNHEIIQLDLRPRSKYNLLSNQNLIIHNITKADDNRTYACIVDNQIDNDRRQSRFKSLRVRDRSPFGPELSISNNTEYRAVAGSLIELPCGVASVSNHARVSWWKNDVEMSGISDKVYNNSLILQLSNTSSSDSGNYACRIDDESSGRIISSMTLKVDLPIQCKMSVEHTNISAGSTAELICTTNSIRSSSFSWQWYHNSNLLSSTTNRYTITNSTRADMGMYQCCYLTSSSDSSTCCAQSQIRVIHSPPFILTAEQTYSNIIIMPSNNTSHVPIDLNLTLYADPLPTIELYKDGQQLISQNRMEVLPSRDLFTHYRIYVSNLNETGLYEYRINNSFGSITYSKHLNIEKQKPFLQIIPNQTVTSGKEFVLACYVSGQPNLQLKWIDQLTKQVLNTSLTSPILLRTTTIKSNIYTCQGNNPYGESSQSVYVSIQIPAKILSSTTNRTMKINETLNIACVAEGDHQLELKLTSPQSNNFYLIETKSDYRKTLSFTIEHVHMSDHGLYECYAKNNYSEDRSRFEIIVQNVPNQIEKVFIENSNRISWIKPFDGNANIVQYILRVQYKQGMTWSNETIIAVNGTDRTSYSFENYYSKCSMSITIEAVNPIGSSLPSAPLHFQINPQQLLITPSNLTAIDISSKSVMLSWQYPSFQLCDNSFIEYIIELYDEYTQILFETYRTNSTLLTINDLKSSTGYSLVVYARNEVGPSPKSQPLMIQTLESVPLAMITDLTAILLNTTSVHLTWTFENDAVQFLNGKFRAFAVAIYEQFNMSTFRTMETINPSLIIDNLHSSSQYYMSVAVCNYFDCGPSSLAIRVETPLSNLDMSRMIVHPITKPLVLDCPSTNSWSRSGKSIHEYILNNNSLFMPHPKLDDTYSEYYCGSKQYVIRFYDKPAPVLTKIHYTTSNEIGLKLRYSSDIIESLTITYKSKQNSFVNEIHISPPSPTIQLTNLSCGNTYDIVVLAKNQAGFSISDSIIGKTDGSIPTLIQSKELIETITDHFIILNMSNWLINQCSIISFEIEISPVRNSTEQALHQFYSFKNHLKSIQIDNLQSNQDYQLQIKVNSQAGEIIKIVSFRTTNDQNLTKSRSPNYYIIIIIIAASCLLALISSITVFISIKFCRLHWKNADIFIGQTRKLKPVICSSYPHHHYHGKWLTSNNEFTIENYTDSQIENSTRPYSYASEDSQGNINPYAVTGWTSNCKEQIDHSALWRDNKHAHCLIDPTDLRPSTTPSERYFRPIILESSSLDNEEACKRNPLVQIPSQYSLSNQQHPPQASSSVLSTVSSSQGELFSAFTLVPSSKQTTLNTKKYSNNNHILADQSSSSADSGVHSSYTQSPITKHSYRKCHTHGFSYDRPSSADANDDQEKHLYATYDHHFTFLSGTTPARSSIEPSKSSSYRYHEQEQYSLV